MIADLIGYAAGILGSSIMIPQIIKSLKTKSVRDLSFLMIFILIICSFLWMIYGIMIKSMPITLMNVVSILINSILLIIKIKYENKKIKVKK